MVDYGHELAFGLFPSPDAAEAQQTLDLAQLADATGLDLVTVQDHPYNATHLDTWTLLSVIAARTTTVRVAANVANLPLRPPVVLARSVATLDILSGGRAELGLGTGALWDAIVAAGGQRRTPKEAVDALVEAIRIIRGVWGQDPEQPDARSLTLKGEHYAVTGLHPGPRPAHVVEIWLGAYRARMLRVTGRQAQGWLPSMGYAEPPSLPAMNAVIDEAADRAGRGPSAVRRMYNIVGRFGTGSGFLQGSSHDWAEQLAELTLTTGMSTYILGSDDREVVARFAAEVAPAVRDLVQTERVRRTAIPQPSRGQFVSSGSPERGPETTRTALSTLQVQPTPDDGMRLSATMPWDEVSRPVAPKPSSAAYTAVQQSAAQHLVDIHDHLRGELTQVRGIVAQVRQGLLSVAAARSGINTMAMRQNTWALGAYCQSYCRVVTGHHTLEDRSVFTHLRRSDATLEPVLDRLEQEHHVIADVLEQVDEGLVGLAGSDGYGAVGHAALDELQAAIDVLTDTLLSHLAYEERELLHPLAAHGLG